MRRYSLSSSRSKSLTKRRSLHVAGPLRKVVLFTTCPEDSVLSLVPCLLHPLAQCVFNVVCPHPHWSLPVPPFRNRAINHSSFQTSVTLDIDKALQFPVVMLYLSQSSPMFRCRNMSGFFNVLVLGILRICLYHLSWKATIFFFIDCKMEHNSSPHLKLSERTAAKQRLAYFYSG